MGVWQRLALGAALCSCHVVHVVTLECTQYDILASYMFPKMELHFQQFRSRDFFVSATVNLGAYDALMFRWEILNDRLRYLDSNCYAH